LLEILHSRLDNDPETEMAVVADELRKIARLRLMKVVEQCAPSPRTCWTRAEAPRPPGSPSDWSRTTARAGRRSPRRPPTPTGGSATSAPTGSPPATTG